MSLNFFYQRKKRYKKIFTTINLMIAVSLFLNFSFPSLGLAKNNPPRKRKKFFKTEINLKYKEVIKSNKITKKKKKEKIKEIRYIWVTAYSSTPDQCDSTPFITANGTHVHDGIIAANFLPFGTKVRFPEYSNKIYIVADRMHPRFPNRADIWMPTRQAAKNFGIKKLKMEILK